MGPSMNTDFMSSHVLLKEKLRALDSAGANDKEGRLQLLLVQELEQRSMTQNGISDMNPYDPLIDIRSYRN